MPYAWKWFFNSPLSKLVSSRWKWQEAPDLSPKIDSIPNAEKNLAPMISLTKFTFYNFTWPQQLIILQPYQSVIPYINKEAVLHEHFESIRNFFVYFDREKSFTNTCECVTRHVSPQRSALCKVFISFEKRSKPIFPSTLASRYLRSTYFLEYFDWKSRSFLTANFLWSFWNSTCRIDCWMKEQSTRDIITYLLFIDLSTYDHQSILRHIIFLNKQESLL